MVEWLRRWVCMRLSGFKSRSNHCLGFVSGCPRFNSTTLCKPVGVLNNVSVKFQLFLAHC